MNGHNDCLKCKSFSKSVFSCLEKNSIGKSLSTNSVSISYKKGQDIYVEGAAAKGVFCIQEGKAKVYKNCEARSITIALGGSSDLIGYSGLFNGGTYINSAKCLEDSEICFIPKKNFMNILSSNNELQLALLKQSCQEIQRISNFIKELKCKNMRSRVLSTLVTLTNKFGLDENHCLNISLTRKEISELSGTTTESVIRILNDLKKEKLITLVNNKIKIPDISKLKFSL